MEHTEISSPTTKQYFTESYHSQSRQVCGRGKHILAQFDKDSVVVNQAFTPKIAKYAAENKKFVGCPDYSTTRITWIKTNFLWMMFRSNWASKPNQERVLAIWIRKDAFEQYLANARKKGSVRGFKGTVRLQWDPDHFPNGECHPYRRAVQLGLQSFADGTDIIDIQDITDFVHQESKNIENTEGLVVGRERVYVPESKEAAAVLDL
jgi:hypothetical protein